MEGKIYNITNEELEKRANEGDAIAAIQLSKEYYKGKELNKDPDKGYQILESIKDIKNAKYRLAVLNIFGIYRKRDYEKGLKYLLDIQNETEDHGSFAESRILSLAIGDMYYHGLVHDFNKSYCLNCYMHGIKGLWFHIENSVMPSEDDVFELNDLIKYDELINDLRARLNDSEHLIYGSNLDESINIKKDKHIVSDNEKYLKRIYRYMFTKDFEYNRKYLYRMLKECMKNGSIHAKLLLAALYEDSVDNYWDHINLCYEAINDFIKIILKEYPIYSKDQTKKDSLKDNLNAISYDINELLKYVKKENYNG